MSKIPHVYSHRGGRRWAPENTLKAFEKSVAAGFFGIEMDVHECKSGELVVIHDANLAATTDGKGFVRDLTLADIKKLDAGSKFAAEFANERVPTLEETLNTVSGKLTLNIEVKNAPHNYLGIVDKLIKVLATYAHPGKIVISSFDHQILRSLSLKAPQYKLAVLVNAMLIDVGSYAKSVGATVLHPFYINLRADSVAEAQAAGLEVNVWTLNTIEEWTDAVAAGVDGIVTDDPEGLQKFLSNLPTSTTVGTDTPCENKNDGQS